ncbi:MAG: SMI1/KNR4 family protein [Planctomycetota bacterium]
MLEWITDRIEAFLRQVESLGGEVEPLEIGPPATEQAVDSIEKKLGQALPSDLRTFVTTVSSRIAFNWVLPDAFDRPEPLAEIFGGGLAFDLADLPMHEKDRVGWQGDVFPDPEDEYDQVWHNKLGFHDVPNGDYLSFDPEGRVIYLSHDDGEGHGYIMAPSFTELLKRWIPLGCPGPEDWQWLPFVADARSGIQHDSEHATLWLKLLGF